MSRGLRLLTRRLGARLLAAEPTGRGDAGATRRITLADGRTLAARYLAGDGAATRTEAMRRNMARLAAEGLPVPSPSTVEVGGGSWLLTPWVDGEPGSAWLDDPGRARQLGRRMGELALRIRQLGSVAVERDHSRPEATAPAGEEPTPFVHGDFAPINVLVDGDGEIVALLDFEHAGPGPALLDVAWWGWVVRHHHPEAWEAAWPTFLAAAGLGRGPIERTLHALALRGAEGQGDRRRRR